MQWVIIALVVLFIFGRHDFMASRKKKEEEANIQKAIDLAVKLEREKMARAFGADSRYRNRNRARKRSSFKGFSKH